jgi:hypothetical protein
MGSRLSGCTCKDFVAQGAAGFAGPGVLSFSDWPLVSTNENPQDAPTNSVGASWATRLYSFMRSQLWRSTGKSMGSIKPESVLARA